ncbi:hypothetical protein HUT16_32810 [Kitasatospora sp. NA04385]|uniref:hypothetical protein n=1 Tax=Kitasatospora sp. NA04385 TaxID=2742135 RepID=UPI0015907770|nr:hypothetical protein [Kitasatospora sp. NA04385]QKW23230.1 hypothetical protein HUT16_32810 [Kitasatospora sp. NA04385]
MLVVPELPTGSWWDWDVVSTGPELFVLGADYDLSYHHGLELRFHGPVFVQCPEDFSDPVFRAATAQEAERVVRAVGGPPEVLVAFECDVGGVEPATGLIAARRLEIETGAVFRYWREHLEPGQRRAPWVRPPGE